MVSEQFYRCGVVFFKWIKYVYCNWEVRPQYRQPCKSAALVTSLKITILKNTGWFSSVPACGFKGTVHYFWFCLWRVWLTPWQSITVSQTWKTSFTPEGDILFATALGDNDWSVQSRTLASYAIYRLALLGSKWLSPDRNLVRYKFAGIVRYCPLI